MTHMRAIPKPAYARMQRASKRLKAAQLAANAVRVRERDGDRCRVCSSAELTEVHHIRYRSRGGGHETANLVLLCGECHRAVHDGWIRLAGNGDGLLEIWHTSPKTARRIA